MKAQRHASIEDLARARFERQSFTLECDGERCGSRGVFDSIAQIGGWLVDGTLKNRQVLVLCPRCNARRKKRERNAS